MDLVWVNGANFKAMRWAATRVPSWAHGINGCTRSIEGLLYIDWADRLPAAQYYDLTNPAIALDFGYAVYASEFPYNVRGCTSARHSPC